MQHELPSGLIVATSLEPPAGQCMVCEAVFTARECRPGGEYEKHVAKCSDQHETELRAMSLSEKLPWLYGPDAIDRELEDWVHRRRGAIIEGRVKP
jgi:hypothetical protein